MKKLSILALLAFLVLGLSASVFGASVGTVTQSAPTAHYSPGGAFGSLGPDPKYVVTATLTGAASGGTYPTFVINGTCTATTGSCTALGTLDGWYLFKVETYHGTTPPDNLWSATVTDDWGYDLCANKMLANQSSSVSVVTDCYPSGQNYMPRIAPLTVTVTGNATASAVIYMRFIFLPR